MSIFVVITRNPNPGLEAQIVREFPSDHYILSPNHWLVCSGGTSIELSERIGVTKGMPPKAGSGEHGPGLVFSISSYYGSETPDLWEWLKVKWEKNCD